MAGRRRGIEEEEVRRRRVIQEDVAWRKQRYGRRKGMEEGEVWGRIGMGKDRYGEG